MVRRPGRVRLFPFQGVGRVARARLWQGAGQLLRDAGRAAHGDAGTDVHQQRVLRQGRRARARRQRLRLRPLRLSGIPAGQHPAEIAGRHGVLSDPGEVRLREVRVAARVLQAMRVPARLLGRVSEEPAAAHAGWRAGTQLSLPGSQAVFRARGHRPQRSWRRSCARNRLPPSRGCEPTRSTCDATGDAGGVASRRVPRVVRGCGAGACGRGRGPRADPERHRPVSSCLSGNRQRHARAAGSGNGAARRLLFRAARCAALQDRTVRG